MLWKTLFYCRLPFGPYVVSDSIFGLTGLKLLTSFCHKNIMELTSLPLYVTQDFLMIKSLVSVSSASKSVRFADSVANTVLVTTPEFLPTAICV